MKISFETLFALCLVCLGMEAELPLKAAPPQLCIVSPDHPETWDVDYNPKLEQKLWWSERDRVLVALVSYSRISSPQLNVQSIDCHTFYLTFPQVGLDLRNCIYILNQRKEKIIIGHLGMGAFGKQIRLDDSVELSAHRKKGEMWGMLVAKDVSKLKRLPEGRKIARTP